MQFDPNSSENKLIFDKAKGGSQAFRQELLKQQTSSMYYLARTYLKDSEEAKEAVRLGFQKAFKRFDTCENIQHFDKWLKEIVRFSALSLVVPVKAEAYEGKYSAVDERADTSLKFDSHDVACKQFLQVLNVLSDGQRAAVSARYYEHMSVDKTATLLQLSKEDTEGLLINAKKEFSKHQLEMPQFLALVNFINLDDSLVAQTEVVAPLVETQKATTKIEPIREETEVKEEAPVVESKKEAEDDVDYEDDEGFDDYDYDKHGNRKRHKSHWFLKLLVFVGVLLCLVGGMLAAVYKVDEDMFYAIPGTTRLVSLIEKVTGKEIPGPFDSSQTVAPISSAEATQSATPSPTSGLIAGSEDKTDLADQIGMVKISLATINIRSTYSTSGDIVGTVYQGETYGVYGIYKADDYTWYRIGENQWIATDGTYLEYTPNA